MNLSPILKRFVDRAPLPVMMRAVLERELDAVQLDRWFETVAQQQYTRKLLFSSLFELMTQVVLRQSGSIRAAWLQTEGEVGVSLASVYNKLNGLEVGTSAALVDFAAQRSREMIDAMDGGSLELLAGVPVRVLDGRQHRLKVTRQSTAAPLPGKALVVFDPQRETMQAMVPCEDGHAQERRLLGQIGTLVEAGQVWLADRNFCTEGFLNDLSERGAYSLIREHDNLRFTPLQATHSAVRCEAQGCVVSEQWVQLKSRAAGTEGLKLRRIRIQLDTPTRCAWPGRWQTSTHDGPARHQTPARRERASDRRQHACPWAARPATASPRGSSQQLSHPERALTCRRTRPGDVHGCCASAQLNSDICAALVC